MDEIHKNIIDLITNDKIDISKLSSTQNYFRKKLTSTSNMKEIVCDEINKNKNKKKIIKTVLRIIGKNVCDIIEASSVPIDIKCFNICGCNWSTDIDIFCVVSQKELQDIKLGKKINMKQIVDQLIELEYDVQRDVDINYICIDNNKNITECYKGGCKESQNIIFYTYQHHKQKYPCIVSRSQVLNVDQKINVVTKYFLDNLETIIGSVEYQHERVARRTMYTKTESRTEYVIKFLSDKKIDVNQLMESTNKKGLDVIKSLTVKIIQTILLKKEIYAYTKSDMVEKIMNCDENLKINEQNFLYLLTRGKLGEKENIQTSFDNLVDHFLNIVDEHNNKHNFKHVTMSVIGNPTSLSNELVTEFIKSPITPSKKFTEIFENELGGKSLNECFQIKSVNSEKLPIQLEKFVFTDAQRSKYWLGLIKKFTCGNNTQIKKHGQEQDVFHLVRGAIMECFAIENIDYCSIVETNVTKCTIGLLVEDLQEGSIGIAPDVLLINPNNDNIIPVEIKCLNMKYPCNSRDYHRGLRLAEDQISRTKMILEKHNVHVLDGIIIFIYVWKDENNQVHIETKYSKLHF
jgi:hypothetical protein